MLATKTFVQFDITHSSASPTNPPRTPPWGLSLYSHLPTMHLLIILVFMASLCGFHVILVSGLTLGNPGVFSRGVLLSLASSLLDEPARWKTFLQTSPRCPLELRIKQEIRARSFTWKGFKRQAHRLCGGPHGLLSTLLALVSHRVLIVTPELVLHLYLRVCENKAQSGRRQSSLHATSLFLSF